MTYPNTIVKKVKAVLSSSMEIHLRTTGWHLPSCHMGSFTQCYLPPDTSEHTPP